MGLDLTRLLTRSSKVAQGDLGRLDLAGYIFGHALIDALVRLPGVLDHQRAVFQQVQATVVTHVQSIAAMEREKKKKKNQMFCKHNRRDI